MAAKIDMVGRKFGRLTVVEECGVARDGKAKWLCICDCGNKAEVIGKLLRTSLTRSCGCLHRETSIMNLPSNAKPIGYERMTRTGYVEIKTPRGFVRKHIHVMEESISRRLADDEVVHHIDGNKLNNDISNLQLMTNAEHTALHNRACPHGDETRRRISKANQKYSQSQAEMVRALVATGTSQRAAAQAVGMSQMVASRIVRNLTYKEK